MSDLLQIRCLVCEEPFDQLEGAHPGHVVGGAVVSFNAEVVGVHSAVPDARRDLRGYLCEECIYVKGKNGLLHLVRTTTTHEYQTWKPSSS